MVSVGFRQEILELPLAHLYQLKHIDPRIEKTAKYRQIKASLAHVGLIEPLAVFPQSEERFLVANGNLRLHILRELKADTATCTVALDDEAYTYNKRVNPLSPITEHFMILKAIENGVSEERIALGLNIDVRAIRARRSLLDGICPEAVELLKDKRIGSRTFPFLRRMKPLRQIEAAELMISGKNYSAAFASSILNVTPKELWVKPEKLTRKIVHDGAALLDVANEGLITDLAKARRTYGENVLSLTVICRNLENLLDNAAVGKYLERNHAEILKELRELVSCVNSERTAAAS